ncbi:uncharacterized protein LOC122300311 [Carya illinoinensis]|uniref:uncharacterized protein LOC122300311 n=1 Tax=Carya illinoinensis TaxID=32201 RepID=UPI001C71FF35|nr:uncharacterized protein LOC122300311 [Carya illinoinensis]
MAKEKKPKIMFLIETLLVTSKLEGVRKRVGLENCFGVDPVGRSGGLAMLWSGDLVVEIQNYSRWHINAWVENEVTNQRWLFTGFYGHPETAKRNMSWELLCSLKPPVLTPWCVAGDFNELVSQSEKFGGRQRGEAQMCRFREALEVNDLCDLGYKGDKFTWSNRHIDDTFTKERLDRCVANSSWREIFNHVWVETLPARSSDHKPLVVGLSTIQLRRQRYSKPSDSKLVGQKIKSVRKWC